MAELTTTINIDEKKLADIVSGVFEKGLGKLKKQLIIEQEKALADLKDTPLDSFAQGYSSGEVDAYKKVIEMLGSEEE